MCDKEHYDKLVQFIQDSNNKQTKELKIYIEKEITEIRKEINEERETRKQLEEEYRQLSDKYLTLEKSLRKNNIVLFGVKSTEDKSILDVTLETLNTNLNLNLKRQDVNNVYAIGKQNQNKPIIVKFVSFITKLEVLKSSKKLKGTPISVAEDLSLEERKINKTLRPYLLEARTKNLRAYIKNNKLHINSKEYTVDQLLHNESDFEEMMQEGDGSGTMQEKDHPLTGLSEAHPLTRTKKRANAGKEKNEIDKMDPKQRRRGGV